MTSAIAARFTSAVDPDTVTAVTGGFTDLKSLLTTALIPALFGLVLLGLAVAVGIKWMRKGAKSA